MTILVKKVFISSKPTFVYLLCPPLCGPFSIQESAAGGLSYKEKRASHLEKLLTNVVAIVFTKSSNQRLKSMHEFFRLADLGTLQ